ncbi:MAG TPA: enoyl-CoA hydratase [Acidimicrobiales bacterium]
MSDLVLVDVADRIALITLNRPEARNALSSEMLSQLVGHMVQLDARVDVDVMILTGAGRAFCAGLDLKEMAASGSNIRPGDGRPWPQLAKPLIGAVNGAAVTGGLELALACDFLVASDQARFADTHTRVGLVPFWGMSVLLPQAVGVRVAREMSLTGNFIGADEAARVGLVNRVVPHEDLLTVARALAADVASADQASTRVLVAEYARFSGGGSDALAEEIRTAEAFLGAGIDPVLIEQRRVALIERARQQSG